MKVLYLSDIHKTVFSGGGCGSVILPSPDLNRSSSPANVHGSSFVAPSHHHTTVITSDHNQTEPSRPLLSTNMIFRSAIPLRQKPYILRIRRV
ncbi:hypothetical protein Hanom_Chr05g00464101 [Helianthus anomalus]